MRDTAPKMSTNISVNLVSSPGHWNVNYTGPKSFEMSSAIP